jgi:hypothetical protein
VFEETVGAFALDGDDDFLETACLGFRCADDLGRKAMSLGELHVHAHEVAREEAGLVAARARADLEE